MLGFRGASRYYDARYADGFALECAALLRARRDLGLTNIKVMIPFCRTVDEGRRVIAAMARQRSAAGRGRARDLCDVRGAVERHPGRGVPARVRRLLDRVERSDAAHARPRSRFGHRRAPVRRTQRRRALADRARDRARPRGLGKPIGICGQAPSDYPEFAEWLVREQIDSISLNPDTAITTTLRIADAEKALATR